MIIKQSLNGVGAFGVMLAVGGPLASFATASWSAAGVIGTLTNRYSYQSPEDFIIHPAVYALLIAASAVGWVMVIIGREYRVEGAQSTFTAPPSGGNLDRLEGYRSSQID